MNHLIWVDGSSMMRIYAMSPYMKNAHSESPNMAHYPWIILCCDWHKTYLANVSYSTCHMWLHFFLTPSSKSIMDHIIYVDRMALKPHNYIMIITLRSRQSDRLLADDIFTCIFLNEKVWISINISLKFVPEGQINNIPILVQIMAWRRSGNKPLSEPMMFSLLRNIFVTRPQWVIWMHIWKKYGPVDNDIQGWF